MYMNIQYYSMCGRITPFFLQIVDRVEATTLSAKVALHVRALSNYTDIFGIDRCVCVCTWLVLVVGDKCS